MKRQIVVITNKTEDPWILELSSTLSSVGIVRCLPDSLAADEVLDKSLLVVVDAGAVRSMEGSVSGLVEHRPALPVIVMTASPTWKRARAAFEAGASDYLPKSMRGTELVTMVTNVLARGARRKAQP